MIKVGTKLKPKPSFRLMYDISDEYITVSEYDGSTAKLVWSEHQLNGCFDFEKDFYLVEYVNEDVENLLKHVNFTEAILTMESGKELHIKIK